MTESQEAIIKKLQTTHIHFATPCYGGVIHEACFASYLKFSMLAVKHGINFSIDTMSNESLIPRGRNNMVAKFLSNKQATHLMWVDADIAWEPESVLRMALYNAGVVCGLYPMKGLPVRYVLNTLTNGRREGPLLEVSTSGTGFMLIHRSVIERLVEAMPETKYKDSLRLGPELEQYMYALFDTMIDEHGYYLSEDWTFCKRVREKLHIPIWVDTEIKLNHLGNFAFEGNTDIINQLADEWTKTTFNHEKQVEAYPDVTKPN